MMVGPTALRNLSWRERWLLAQALVALPATALALRCMPFRQLRSLLDSAGRAGQALDRARAERIAHMVAAAAEYGPYRASCLPQTLVLQWMLRRHGMPGELRFGVKKIDGRVAGHCWIELEGKPLIDSAAVAQHFTVLEPSPVRWSR